MHYIILYSAASRGTATPVDGSGKKARPLVIVFTIVSIVIMLVVMTVMIMIMIVIMKLMIS